MCELSATLATNEGSGYVVAPAGYGKTHLIAESTARSTGRQTDPDPYVRRRERSSEQNACSWRQ